MNITTNKTKSILDFMAKDFTKKTNNFHMNNAM